MALLQENRLLDANGRVADTFERNWTMPVTLGGDCLGTLVIVPVTRQTARSVPLAPAASECSESFRRILAAAPSLQQEVRTAERLADLPVPVLLQGETGVGKERFARAIHDSGGRATGPFVAINRGSLSRELLASELFGYVDGAFTGARRGGMKGKIEAADGGTLFLDEIGELPLDMQPHLLRVLQENEIYRLGEGLSLDDALRGRIRAAIRANASPRHVPARILQVEDIPRTRSGKITELAVRRMIHGEDPGNREALANPEALEQFRDRPELDDD